MKATPLPSSRVFIHATDFAGSKIFEGNAVDNPFGCTLVCSAKHSYKLSRRHLSKTFALAFDPSVCRIIDHFSQWLGVCFHNFE
jgi:hypothetical protein